jgi:tyrosyl-tRNA synthetase
MNLLDDLEYRGLLYQVTDREALNARLNSEPITLYIGFDPTADSLHIGNLLQIMLLRRFQLAGHHPIAVVGTGTGLVGDPSGKTSERTLNPKDVVDQWAAKIRSQLERYLDFETQTNPARIVSNYDWLGELELLSFLRKVGKHFPLGQMLAKDSVKSRLESGISFSEFSYMILQAYDFLRLRMDYGCELQAGGSDQWGNITSGIELIRRVSGKSAFGLTLPLVTSADGTKLGKTEVGTVWIDADLTSPYQFYQYWINIDDADVIQFLKYFTFFDQKEVAELENEVATKAWERAAQRELAREVTAYVHGKAAVQSAENISQALFYGNVAELSAAEIEEGLYDVPSHKLSGEAEIGLVDLLVDAGITTSKRQAREDLANGAIYVNGTRTTEIERCLAQSDRIAGQYVVIRRGKTRYHLIDWRD